jgi:hypothetical protein
MTGAHPLTGVTEQTRGHGLHHVDRQPDRIRAMRLTSGPVPRALEVEFGVAYL